MWFHGYKQAGTQLCYGWFLWEIEAKQIHSSTMLHPPLQLIFKHNNDQPALSRFPSSSTKASPTFTQLHSQKEKGG